MFYMNIIYTFKTQKIFWVYFIDKEMEAKGLETTAKKQSRWPGGIKVIICVLPTCFNPAKKF